MEASLKVLTGKKQDREIPLPEGLFVIGRDPLCHLRPHCNLVSRRHCAIACVEGRVLVRDLKSVNGTFLNDKALIGQTAVRDGDILRVGDLSFPFHVKSVGNQPAPPLSEDAFRWLIESPEDSATLDSGSATHTGQFSLLKELRESLKDSSGEKKPAAASKDSGSKNLSAGKFLKDRLRKSAKK